MAQIEPAIAYYHLAKRSQPADQKAYILVARHYNEIVGSGAPLDWTGHGWSRSTIERRRDDEIALRARRIISAGWQRLVEPSPMESELERVPGTRIVRNGDQVIVIRRPAPAAHGQEPGEAGNEEIGGH